MLLAAADPVGDAMLLWRAAATLGVERQAADAAAGEQLLEVGAQVRFRHPLVRSAAYRAATASDRRAVHGALATATDPETDPDRRAWHRAHAAIAPDEEVAGELIDSASRARARGGIAAAAAFLERAVTFTPDPGERASRALTAAKMMLGAGDLAAAGSLLAVADAGPPDELRQARAQRVHAQIAFDMRRGSDAPPLLVRTAQRLESLDPELARETHLKALVAVIYAARLATDPAPAGVARAALSAPLGPEPLPAMQLMLLGLATRLTDGHAAATPTLTAALRVYLAEERHLDWSWVAYGLAAMDLWDDDAWLELASSQVELARATGALILLPFALDYLATFHIQAGNLSLASALSEEAQSLDLGGRAETLPYVPLGLAAWRGNVSTVLNLVDVMIGGAHTRGEGCAVTAAEYATAILYNGLGEYELAFEAAQKAAAADEIATSPWALSELVEAAARSGREEIARESLDQLCERTSASGTAWAKGTEARASALLEDGESAEYLYRAAIEALGQSRMAAHLARARLELRRMAPPSRTGGSTRASSSARLMTFSPRWVRLDSPTGRDASCWPRARRCASVETTLAMSSLPRRSRSRDLPATVARTRRLVRSCTSATAPWSGTCGRFTRSLGSAPGRASVARCGAATGKRRRCDRRDPQGPYEAGGRPCEHTGVDQGITRMRRPVRRAQAA